MAAASASSLAPVELSPLEKSQQQFLKVFAKAVLHLSSRVQHQKIFERFSAVLEGPLLSRVQAAKDVLCAYPSSESAEDGLYISAESDAGRILSTRVETYDEDCYGVLINALDEKLDQEKSKFCESFDVSDFSTEVFLTFLKWADFEVPWNNPKFFELILPSFQEEANKILFPGLAPGQISPHVWWIEVFLVHPRLNLLEFLSKNPDRIPEVMLSIYSRLLDITADIKVILRERGAQVVPAQAALTTLRKMLVLPQHAERQSNFFQMHEFLNSVDSLGKKIVENQPFLWGLKFRTESSVKDLQKSDCSIHPIYAVRFLISRWESQRSQDPQFPVEQEEMAFIKEGLSQVLREQFVFPSAQVDSTKIFRCKGLIDDISLAVDNFLRLQVRGSQASESSGVDQYGRHHLWWSVYERNLNAVQCWVVHNDPRKKDCLGWDAESLLTFNVKHPDPQVSTKNDAHILNEIRVSKENWARHDAGLIRLNEEQELLRRLSLSLLTSSKEGNKDALRQLCTDLKADRPLNYDVLTLLELFVAHDEKRLSQRVLKKMHAEGLADKVRISSRSAFYDIAKKIVARIREERQLQRGFGDPRYGVKTDEHRLLISAMSFVPGYKELRVHEKKAMTEELTKVMGRIVEDFPVRDSQALHRRTNFLSRLFQGNDFIVDWQSDLLYRPETAQKVLVLLLNLPCLTETLTPEAKLSILDRLFRVLTDPEQVLRPDFNWVGHFERFLSQAYSSRRLVSFVQPAGAENGSAEFKPDDSPAAQRVAQHKRDQHKRDHYDVSQNAQRWMQLIQAHQELAKLIEQMKVVLLTLNGTCELSKFKMVQGLKAFAVLVRMIAICRRAREEDIAPWPQSKHCAKLLAELDLTHLPSVLDAQVQLRSLVRLLPTEPFCKTAKLESEQPPSDPLKSRVVAGVRTLVNYPNGVEGFEQLKTSYSYLVNPTEDEVIQHVVVLAKNRLAAKTRRRQPATWAIYNLWSQLGDPANLTEQNVYKLERSIQTHCASSRHQIVPSASIMLTCASLWDEYLQGLDPRVKSLFLAVMGGQVGPLFNQLVKNPSEEAAASSSAATAPQVEVDVRDAYGRSLLRWAVEYPDVGISLAMVDLLLRLGATCADYGFGTTGQDCRDQAGYMPFNMSQNQGVTERLSAASNLKVVRDAEVDATFTSSRRSRDGHYRADQLMLDVIEYAEKDYANWNSIVDFYNASSVRSVESLRRLLAYATAYPEPEISVGDGDKEHLRALTEEILKRRLNAFLKSGSKLPALVRLAWANNKYLIQNVVGDSSEGPLNRIAAVFMLGVIPHDYDTKKRSADVSNVHRLHTPAPKLTATELAALTYAPPF